MLLQRPLFTEFLEKKEKEKTIKAKEYIYLRILA